eukprot:4029394-Amphidinium_carterae.1
MVLFARSRLRNAQPLHVLWIIVARNCSSLQTRLAAECRLNRSNELKKSYAQSIAVLQRWKRHKLSYVLTIVGQEASCSFAKKLQDKCMLGCGVWYCVLALASQSKSAPKADCETS